MRKKQLIEQLAALKQKRSDENARLAKLSNEGAEVPTAELEALFAMDPEVEKLEAELAGIEKLEAAAKRNVSQQTSTRVETHNLAEDKPWSSFGEFLCSVAHAGSPGQVVDPRLHQLAASGQSEGVPSDGGFLVRTEWSDELYRESFAAGELASRCDTKTLTTGNATSFPYVNETSRTDGGRWGGIRVYRAAEAGTVAASTMKLDRMEVKVEKLMGIGYVTEELLADAPLMESYVREAFTEEHAVVLDSEIYGGNGAGQCLGIMNSQALVTVAKESGQAAATVVAENIVNMFSRMLPRARREAVWLVNTDVQPQLSLMKVGDTPVYLPPGGLANDPYGRLLGLPVIPIEQCETIGTTGDILLVNMKRYLLARRGGLRADASMHIRFLYDEMAFRFITRVNGQPKLKTAITPMKGNNTLSAFVALATRA